MQRTADAVLVGAGVMGASVAFHLARRGVRRVLVLEKTGIAAGGTGKSAAFIRMHYTNEPEARMAIASFPIYQNWADAMGGDGGFTRTGFVMTVPPEDAEALRQNVAMLQRLGAKTEVLTAAELKGVAPALATEDLAVAAYEPESGYADPVATTRAFLDRAQALGARLEVGAEVLALRVRAGHIAGVTTTRGPVDATTVILLTGPWTPRLLRTAGTDLPITPQRAQLAAFARPAALAAGHPTVIDGAVGSYFRPTRDNLTLVGVGLWDGKGPADPDTYDQANDPEFLLVARQKLTRRLPAMGNAPYVRGHAGIYDMSPDTRAILDEVPGIRGLFVAAGFSGTGFKKAPAVGACLSELVLDGRGRTVDLRPFRWSRYAENDPIRGQYEYRLPADFGHRV
ncbi:MAG: FAD-binding oxidoreductase [candidate division NC10 bacterium]|nr:FAD-binding oxidoreductase [candidate division NC10 bacterium]